MSIYFDYNATTPVLPEVADLVYHYMVEEFGNAGSRTHDFGSRAAKAVKVARKQVAEVIDKSPEDIIFTSGATESNNLAILGLKDALQEAGKTHIITSAAEHKAVIEPIQYLEEQGFAVTWLNPTLDGFVPAESLENALRPETGLVSLMHVNNETGIIQPIEKYCEVLKDHEAYFHTDSAQGYGKDIERLRNDRIDLISISGHKIFAPKGIGALYVRYRPNGKRVTVKPLLHGGGQERGLRPGTLPVPLIVGLGKAAELAIEFVEERSAKNKRVFNDILSALHDVGAKINGDPQCTLGNAINFSIDGLDSETAMMLLNEQIAISNGSACTSSSYQSSHVLRSMGISASSTERAIRISWSFLSGAVDWLQVLRTLDSVS